MPYMGILEWLGLRKGDPSKQPASVSERKESEQQKTVPQAPPIPPHLQTPPAFQKPSDWKLPREDLRFLSDSEKINYILQGVFSVYEELKPMADDGTRVSRLQLLLENLTPYERELAKKTIEDLDIDNAVLRFLDYPKSIEEISENIRKSYGYTAARLRYLRSIGKVARLRDPVTNKYKYTKIGESPKAPSPEIPDEIITQKEDDLREDREAVFSDSAPAVSEGEKSLEISDQASEPLAEEPEKKKENQLTPSPDQ